jgi:hypothetical protein
MILCEGKFRVTGLACKVGWIKCLLDSQHTYLHVLVAHQRFLQTSRLRSPSFVETLDHVWASVYPPRRASKGGSKLDTSLVLYLFRS